MLILFIHFKGNWFPSQNAVLHSQKITIKKLFPDLKFPLQWLIVFFCLFFFSIFLQDSSFEANNWFAVDFGGFTDVLSYLLLCCQKQSTGIFQQSPTRKFILSSD